MKRLLAIMGDASNGVEYVRFRQPFEHLKSLGFELCKLGERLALESGPHGYRPCETLFDGIDAVIFPQIVLSPPLPDGSRLDLVGSVFEHARARGIPTIYSVDDYLEGLPTDNVQTILDNVNTAFVTTPVLRDTLATSGVASHVLPNAIDPQRWKPRVRTTRERRIGWAGSASHLADLLMVLPAIRDLQRRQDVTFVLLGLVDRPLQEEAVEVRTLLPGLQGSRRERAERFLELVGMLRDIDYAHIPFVDVESYFEVLPALDLEIGICPLLDTEFNRHKSALKFYEYAMCGTVTVASAVPTYQDEVSITVPNEMDDWAATLEALLKFPREIERELTEQRRYVLEERNIQQWKHRWAEALDTTLAASRKDVPVVAELVGKG